MNVTVGPTLLDRAIAAISPASGLKRMEARTRLAASTSMFGSGGYRGAQGDRSKRRGWTARARSANADMLPGSAKLRAEQRDAYMNQPIATAAIGRTVTFTVGTGLMALPALDAERLGLSPEEKEAWERRIAADYDAYMQSKDPDAERTTTGYGQQDVVLRGVLTSGDILGLRVMPEDQPGRVTRTAWKLVEADRLVNSPLVSDGNADPSTGNKIAGGVEVDAYSAPIAYHVLKEHPGDLGRTAMVNRVPERILAWDTELTLPRVLHPFQKERPEQFRGIGMLAPVLEQLKTISDLSDAELFAAVMSAMIAIVYKSPGAGAMPEPDYGDGTNDDPGAAAASATPSMAAGGYKIESGTVLEIDTDAEVDMKSPGRPNSAFDPFFQAIVRQIGAAIGIPGEVLLAMFNSSYTASKASLEVFYQLVRKWVAWLSAHWCKDVYVCWLAEKVASGTYRMPGFFADLALRAAWCGVDWRGDGKISLNPVQEAGAFKMHQDNGWQTGQQITAQVSGGNYRENIRARGGEHRAWVAEGLPIPVSPGAAAMAPAEEPKKKDEEA